ncbi:hypothetical protein [Maridesulfovibrio zosterae]|uniref:hypothetical protein n=1 Tax=Maridesulfovibrio zosterae TaxID=82171 RepID=UPI0004121C1B|nr:hypothetical protein [Maridesulfovibrio zosterae]
MPLTEVLAPFVEYEMHCLKEVCSYGVDKSVIKAFCLLDKKQIFIEVALVEVKNGGLRGS